jgi:glutathione peroxidase
MTENIYSFKVKDIKGNEIGLDQYKGKVLLIVNTASQCGFTPQYEGLESLYQELSSKNFSILAFPCNQFGGQEPNSNSEILSFCETKFHTTFPLFSKIEVNGNDAHPLYQYLKSANPGILGTEMIKWNFTKFLINKDGIPVKRFSPQDKPEAIKKYILEIL